MAVNVVENYYSRIKHLRVASGFLNDIAIIDDALNFFDEEKANNVISYVAIKYKADLNTIGKMLTGVMVLKPHEVGPKTAEDLYYDLEYLRDCVIICGAVHCGIEDTIRSAIVKINRANKADNNGNNNLTFA